MCQDEIGSKQTQLDNFTQIFSSRLRERMITQSRTQPFTRPITLETSIRRSIPPRSIRLIMSELTRQEDASQSLEEESLDSDHCNHSQQRLGQRPSFKEPQNLKHDDQHDNSNAVSDGSQNRAKFLAAHHQTWTHTTGHAEQSEQHTSIDRNRCKGDNGNTDKRICRGSIGKWA